MNDFEVESPVGPGQRNSDRTFPVVLLLPIATRRPSVLVVIQHVAAKAVLKVARS
jgi:hypothetical protein